MILNSGTVSVNRVLQPDDENGGGFGIDLYILFEPLQFNGLGPIIDLLKPKNPGPRLLPPEPGS